MEHRIFLGLCLFLTLTIQVSRKCYSPVWVKYARLSLGSTILDFHWVLPWFRFHQWCIIIEWNNQYFCWFSYHNFTPFCFNRTMESVNGRWHLWEDVPFAQNLSRKKLHNDLTKPCDVCKEGIRCEWMDNYKGHSICVQRSLLLLLLENQHLIVSLVTNHSRKYIFYSCYPFVYLPDCSRLVFFDCDSLHISQPISWDMKYTWLFAPYLW